MEKKALTVSLIFILTFFLAGCATTGGSSSSELEGDEAYAPAGLAAAAKLRFSDLPVPRGFKLIKDKSFVFQTEETRVALLKYSGRAGLPELVDFYREQMSLCSWRLLNVVEYGKSVLNFERAQQSCIVSIEPGGMRRKIITISVAPRAKGNIEAETEK